MAVYSGTLSAVGASAAPYYLPLGSFNFTLTGTFVATAVLEKSFDATTWVALSSDGTGTANSFTAPVSLLVSEPESVPVYRVRLSAWTSGTVAYRLSP